MTEPADPAGVVALIGAGEFLPSMKPVDRSLLAFTPPIRSRPRVAILPTASAEDRPGTFERWGEMGRAHFESLGTEPVVVPIRTAADAHDPALLDLLQDRDLYYFSGGLPDLLVDVLLGSPAWAAIVEAHRRGAVVAGCSAGAMAFGLATLTIRDTLAGREPRWVPALALVADLCVFPHFDQIHRFASPEQFAAYVASAPAAATVVGIDEEVALVGRQGSWSVHGRQGGAVTILHRSGATSRAPVGASLSLAP
jgi:cyanophycinase